jgi:hypothetical protein
MRESACDEGEIKHAYRQEPWRVFNPPLAAGARFGVCRSRVTIAMTCCARRITLLETRLHGEGER